MSEHVLVINAGSSSVKASVYETSALGVFASGGGLLAVYPSDSRARTQQRDQDDLFATIPHGSGQTYIREILLVADHTAHHVGQIIVVRRLLGAWSVCAK